MLNLDGFILSPITLADIGSGWNPMVGFGPKSTLGLTSTHMQQLAGYITSKVWTVCPFSLTTNKTITNICRTNQS